MTDQTTGAEAPTVPYASVNGLWPLKACDLPALTDDEAIAAVKKLLRFMKVRYTGKFVIGTGNRHTWPRHGVYTVNASKGWHSLVHSVSHYAHRRLHPNKKPHDGTGTHAFIEKEMIRQVLKQGWLDGKLKPKVTAKPKASKTEKQTAKLESIVARIARWEQKERRAQTALAKLAKQRRYYERQLVA